ncbi:MAG: type II-A CRISPR-associated protein Csn2 [Helicobacteraceae bacterium]|nr:type II-A CRISPR-associated protein Csn2 [Helicobacteraceae bacterium]
MNLLTLSCRGIEPDIIIPETGFFTLSIENKNFLFEILRELRNQIDCGKEGRFNISLSGRVLNIEKSVSAIFDFTNIDFNSKAITNLLVKKFSEFLSLGEQAETLINLESIILNLAENFRIKSGLNVEYDAAVNNNNLAKICSLTIADNNSGLLEKLCEYVNLLCDLKPLKLFVLIFGKSFLTESDMRIFYQYCNDKHVRLLIIEGYDIADIQSNERRLIIDKDLCGIAQGYNEFE